MTDQTQKSEYDRGFAAGYALACAGLFRDYSEDSLAAELLADSGFAYGDFVEAGVEEYDLEPLRGLYETYPDLRATSKE